MSPKKYQKLFDLFIITFCLCLFTSTAFAEPWDNMLNAIIGIFTGGTARLIAILVCIGLGLSAWFGRLSWRLAGGFIAGLILVFGSAAVADFFIASV